MKRIDIDDWVCLFIRDGDHLHRFAVPSQWTCGQAAARAHDSMYPDQRKPVDRFTLSLQTDSDSCFGHMDRVGLIPDGAYVEVVSLAKAVIE